MKCYSLVPFRFDPQQCLGRFCRTTYLIICDRQRAVTASCLCLPVSRSALASSISLCVNMFSNCPLAVSARRGTLPSPWRVRHGTGTICMPRLWGLVNLALRCTPFCPTVWQTRTSAWWRFSRNFITDIKRDRFCSFGTSYIYLYLIHPMDKARFVNDYFSARTHEICQCDVVAKNTCICI